MQAACTAPQGLGHGDPGWALSGNAGRSDERGASDDFIQAGNLFSVLDAAAQDRLATNLAGAMKALTPDVQQRQMGSFTKADPANGAGVARKLAVLCAAGAGPAKALSVLPEVAGGGPALFWHTGGLLDAVAGLLQERTP